MRRNPLHAHAEGHCGHLYEKFLLCLCLVEGKNLRKNFMRSSLTIRDFFHVLSTLSLVVKGKIVFTFHYKNNNAGGSVVAHTADPLHFSAVVYHVAFQAMDEHTTRLILKKNPADLPPNNSLTEQEWEDRTLPVPVKEAHPDMSLRLTLEFEPM